MCSTEACGGFVSSLRKSVARGAFPPFLDIIAQNIPYHSTRVRLNVGRLSSYHPHFRILVCEYFRIYFYLFLSTWVSRGSAFFRLRVFFIACVYFRSLNSYYLTFLLPIAEFICECSLTYCHCHSDLPASSVFCGTCFFSSASLAPDGSF